MNDMKSLVLECLSTVLNKEITSDIKRESLDEWDSLRHVELIFMLEDRTGLRFTEDEISGITSTSDIADLISIKNGS